MPETLTAPAPDAGKTGGFDVEAARRDGYSDDDILEHLTTTRKFDIAGALKDGYTKQDIIKHLSGAPAAAAVPPHTFVPGGGTFRGSQLGVRAGGVTSDFSLPEDNAPTPYEQARRAAQTPGQAFNEDWYKLEYELGQKGLGLFKGTAKTAYDLYTKPAIPAPIVNTVKSTASGIANTPQTFEDFYAAAKKGDAEGMRNATSKFIFENAPSLLALEGGVKAGADAGIGAADEASQARALKLRGKELDNLGSVIQSGIKRGAGIDAAPIYQPYVQSFMKRAGVDPAEILPEKGDSVTVARGGSEQVLGRLNNALKKQWNESGRSPAGFVPQTNVQMALAEGAVNEAHAPIANGIRAVRGVKIDGTDPNVPNVQSKVIADLMARKAALSPSQHLAYDANFDAAIADVRQRGSTIGGMDLIRQDWNSGMSRFHAGTPSKVIDADSSSAAVWNDGNNIIRKNLYPAVQDLIDQPGVRQGLADAGRRESIAIQARDGIYAERVRSANQASNVNIQDYIDYVREGPHLAAGAVRSPVMTGVGLGSRLLGRQRPMGEFNAALRKGIGNVSDFTPMDASAFTKKQLTATTASTPDVSGLYRTPIPTIVAAEPKLLPGGVLESPKPDILKQAEPTVRPAPPAGTFRGGAQLPPPTQPPSGGSQINVETGEPLQPQGYEGFAGGPQRVEPPPKGAKAGAPYQTEKAPPPAPPKNHLGVEIGKQEGAAPPKGAKAGAPYQTEEAPPPEAPAPPKNHLGVEIGKQQGAAPPKGAKAGAPYQTEEAPAPAPPHNHLGVEIGNQSGPKPPKNPEMPASAADYFSALKEDEAAAEEAAAPAKAPAPAKKPAAPAKATAPEKKAAPAKPKAEAKAPSPPPKAAKTPAKTETETPVSPPKVTFEKRAAAPKPRPTPTKVDRIIAPAGIKVMEEKASALDRQIQSETSEAAIKDLESRIKQIKSEIADAKKRLEGQDITPAQRNIELRNQPIRTKNLQLLVHLRNQIK